MIFSWEKYLHFFSPQAAARLVTFDPESLGMPSPIVQAGVVTELWRTIHVGAIDLKINGVLQKIMETINVIIREGINVN